jgi:hypothetical protein
MPIPTLMDALPGWVPKRPPAILPAKSATFFGRFGSKPWDLCAERTSSPEA